MKIVITNTAVLNTGDAAILFATIDILRQAFVRPMDVAVYDQQALVARKYYPDIAFRSVFYDQLGGGSRKFNALRLFLAALVWRSPLNAVGRWITPTALHAGLDEFAEADLIVSAGGTYLVPYYRILPKLIDLSVAHALRRPLVLFTQSLGPFPRRKLGPLHFVLRRARAILVRDARSSRHLLEYGIPADRITECADAAFALARESRQDHPPASASARLRVAISVRDWPHIGNDTSAGMERYLSAVTQTVTWLVESLECDVTFLSTCQGIPEYWTDDSAIAETIVGRLPANVRSHVRVDKDFHDPRGLIAQLKTFDLVIATRMHVAILALGAGVPVLPIAYEFKTVELFGRLGLSHLVRDIETITGDDLIATVERFLADPGSIRAQMVRSVERERRSAYAAGHRVYQALGFAS